MRIQSLKILVPLLALSALMMSACNAPATLTPTPTDGISAVYTAAAQTIEAQATQATATPKPSETPQATQTPAVTPTLAAPAAPAASPTSAVSNYCDNSAYIADVTIPDGTVILAGQPFDKTWTLKNIGTCAWTEGYTIAYVSGDLMNGNPRAIGQATAPQQQANVTVKLTAPTTNGTFTGYWRLVNGKGAPFGQIVSVVIKVTNGTGTYP